MSSVLRCLLVMAVAALAACEREHVFYVVDHSSPALPPLPPRPTVWCGPDDKSDLMLRGIAIDGYDLWRLQTGGPVFCVSTRRTTITVATFFEHGRELAHWALSPDDPVQVATNDGHVYVWVENR